MTTPTVKLVNENGKLALPATYFTVSYVTDLQTLDLIYTLPVILIYHTPGGEIELVHSRSKEDKIIGALYDLRECGAMPVDARYVELPSGRIVDINA